MSPSRWLSKPFRVLHSLPALWLILLAVLPLCACGNKASEASPNRLTVFAAASCTDWIEDLPQSGPLRLQFGPSSGLARQIADGAPADIFITAHKRWIDHLEEAGKVEGQPISFANNSLVCIALKSTTFEGDSPSSLGNLVDALKVDDRIAIADESVPAGDYTRQALKVAGQFKALAPFFVGQDDARSTLRAVSQGQAKVGFVYASDVRGESHRVLFPLDESSHDAIQYWACVISGREANGQAEAFLKGLLSAPTRELLGRHGFKAEPFDDLPAGDPEQEKPAYLGVQLPATFHAFSEGSIWRTPIPSDVSLDENSDQMMGYLAKVLTQELKYKTAAPVPAYKDWADPIHVIDFDRSPKRSVFNLSGKFHDSVDPEGTGVLKNVPLPEGIWPESMGDGHMILVDPKKRLAWEFSKFSLQSDGNAVASTAALWDLDGPGYLPPFSGKVWYRSGCNGAGIALIGGIVTYAEMQRGEIQHALNVAIPTVRKKLNRKDRHKLELLSPPAARTDGWGIGPMFIPEGARLQLDPDLDLASLGLNDHSLIVARALQTYGMYVMDNARGLTIHFQNLDDRSGEAWKEFHDLDLSKLTVDHFRVLDTGTNTKR
ncbi:MAG: molybdate ABC transporter substrate-binding protein [Planctomycetes bacterium]|nr:molybdate ABC transporter substrate-binding protein [Planctomycetota bacterium]